MSGRKISNYQHFQKQSFVNVAIFRQIELPKLQNSVNCEKLIWRNFFQRLDSNTTIGGATDQIKAEVVKILRWVVFSIFYLMLIPTLVRSSSFRDPFHIFVCSLFLLGFKLVSFLHFMAVNCTQKFGFTTHT